MDAPLPEGGTALLSSRIGVGGTGVMVLEPEDADDVDIFFDLILIPHFSEAFSADISEDDVLFLTDFLNRLIKLFALDEGSDFKGSVDVGSVAVSGSCAKELGS